MNQEQRRGLYDRLMRIYEDQAAAEWLLDEIERKLPAFDGRQDQDGELTQRDSILITYGDTITKEGTPALRVLADFMETYVKDGISNVHLLPMYPYTSDDGFSVLDYRQINPELGSWEEVKRLSKNYGLMFDAVINHISRSSQWFQKYLQGEEPYTDYFLTCDPDADYSSVTRPRALPLLTKVETTSGEKYVWTTFSEDQIDLNFGCPQLFLEILDILVMYARAGARFIRLDAIGFMWKELGTTCMHLPKTHEAIKVMKDVLNIYAPGTRIITETNVPHEDNISYFGNGGDEADLVYQFPLPPLTMFALQKGDATKLGRWMSSLKLPNDKVTFFNFLSSHDGVGVRPVEGILTMEERDFLVEAALRNGGEVSYKDNGDGTKSPYELNINYQDALSAPDESDETRIDKFLAAETILLSMQGVPGIYIHSLLGSRNDYYGRTTSGIPRRINREKLDYGYVKEQLEQDTNRSRIFHELLRRLDIRKEQTAFSPKASQEVLNLDSKVLALKRCHPKTGEVIYALVNVSGQEAKLSLPGVKGVDLLTGKGYEEEISMKGYQALWLKAG
jgi:glycosidase